MAIGSGLAMSFGFKNESAYGTYATPSYFLPVNSATAARVATRVQGQGISSGNLGPLAVHHAETTNAGTGAVSLDFQVVTMGRLLEALMGSSTSTTLAAPAYKQTHTLADTLGKSLTLQVGAPKRGGTVNPHTLLGAKVTSAEFSCDTTGILGATFNFDGKSWNDTNALVTPSYTARTQPPFHGGQATVKVGTYGAEAAVSGVRSYSLSINRPLDTEDYTAGQSGLKAEPVLNNFMQITGSLTADWLDEATFQDLANATAYKSLVIEHTGALITATHYYLVRFTIPGIIFEPSTQNVDGPGELTNSWSFTWAYDGTNLPKIEYQTTDSAI